MAAQYKTPGVYVVEVDGFSNSVVEVPTAIPAFIGITEYAKNGNQDLTNTPVPISSMVEFQKYFADPASTMDGAPRPQFNYVSNSSKFPPYAADTSGPRFNLYYSLELFFNNGGGKCYIVSIDTYANVIANGGTIDPQLFLNAIKALTNYAEPTMVVMPDAMMLGLSDWKSVSQTALMHCNQMQSRIAILDVLNGFNPPDGTDQDPIAGADGSGGFYSIAGLGEAFDKYGAAYYPWINTNIVSTSNIDFSWLSASTLPALQSDLMTESSRIFPPVNGGDNPKLAPYQKIIGALAVAPPNAAANDPAVITQRSNHQTLMALSPLYQQTINDIATSVNLLPPSGAMAGVYTRNDNTFGVYQSPANTTIISANSPSVVINDTDQQDLNVPLNGLAVNVIRTFPNYGLLVWGARTMAGNSDDWRYVSVRRTMIMLEQSIKAAMQAYVFQSNDALTWTAVNSTISNFLNAQWKDGALVGAKASDAYSVSVGLGSTMTGEDILNGLMNVTVKVAVVRPAEFIVLTFQQQMQTS
jgi:hypothetical protein